MLACFIVFCDLTSFRRWSQSRKRLRPTTCWFGGTRSLSSGYSRGSSLSGWRKTEPSTHRAY